MISRVSGCEDEARAEVAGWESELHADQRSDLRMLGGLLACIVRWRGRSRVSGDRTRVHRCGQLLHALSHF